MPHEPAADADARRAVVRDLDRTVFLEAGAGSGKTRCLVDRFVALVEHGVPADRIAAITFTEKAATELTDRIRGALEERAETGGEACRQALAVLDRAAIGTLHAFAQRILNEHPIEAGLPPRITVLDEIASQVGFDARWEAYVDRLLEDPDMERPVRLLLATSATLADLKDVAQAFDDNWDLVGERLRCGERTIPPVDVGPLLVALDRAVRLTARCEEPSDKLRQHLEREVAVLARRLRDAVDEDARLALVHDPKIACRLGQKGNWPNGSKQEVVEQLEHASELAAAIRDSVQEAVLQVLATDVAGFTVASAEERQAAGELEFHDLLVLARGVLRDAERGWPVRQALAERYQRILLDEFQDTDPIQIELAVLIGSDDPDAAGRPWSEVDIRPGALFFVGDPKQSIYRFRRADIAMFLEARDALVGESRQLTRNFRTGRPIVEWVNATFAEVIVETPESQPRYLPLEPVRDGPPVGPPVLFFGDDHGDVRADAVREVEADDVVTVLTRAARERWSVGHDGAWREPRWSDMAVLLPARTSLPFLERALERAQVPYRAETSSLVYGTREVRDLLVIARAVEDPTDELSVVAALRTPAFACGDDDLYTWKVHHRGRWDHQGEPPDGAPPDHPVARGLRWLGALHRERLWLTPSAVLDRIVRERRLLELAVVERRPRDLWRRMRFVVDQCRAWEEAGGGSLRAYLAWVEGQSAEGARVVETVLPESDDDAVRILTVHGAKGLEFPIVVLSGLTTELRANNRGVQVRFPRDGAWAIKLRKQVSTADFERTSPIDEQMDHHERLRLLYVAATRARDHLAVSVHRNQRKRAYPTSAEVFVRHGLHDGLVEQLQPDDALALVFPPEPPAPPAGPPLPTLDQWRREAAAALQRATRPVATSATRLAAEAAARREAEEEAARAARRDAGLDKGARDIDLPPWQKGRYGTAVGRAVHAVLQVVDLDTGAGVRPAAAAQAAAEGVLGREEVIEALARSALESDVVARAADRPHWREVYVGVPYGEGVLEGYVDLLYRDDAGLVVVDYKTDAWGTEAELDAKVERYGVQLRAYAGAVAEATGEAVVDALLLFCREGPAVVRQVPLALTAA